METMVSRRSKANKAARGCLILMVLLSVGLAACVNKARLRELAGNHIQVGAAYLGSGQYNSALKELMEADKLVSDDPKTHYLLGISYHGKGMSDMAVTELQRSLALDPDNPDVNNHLGAIYLEKGRWDDAIASFRKALANILYDTPALSLYNMGRAYYEKREYDLALKYYGEAMDKDPDAVLKTLIEKSIGICHFAKGNIEEAVRHFQQSLNLAPTFAESHYWLGLCYQKQARKADAVAAFENTIRLAPESEFGRKAKEALNHMNR
jgi:type IV pilus assembly protein PilF